jgi:uncharacterized membrane protein
MEIAVLVLFAAGLVLVSPVIALVALLRAGRIERDLRALQNEVERLRRRDAVPPPPSMPAAPPAPVSAGPVPVAAPLPPRPIPPAVAAPLSATTPAPSVSTAALSPGRPAATPAAARAPRPSAALLSSAVAPRADFATNLGPRILVAAGALALVVFLGLFVKYAWDNDWVGPTGRLLLGALVSVAAVAAGLRLLGREYRPLGQGLAGAGVAGLYVSAFGAHGFYGLVSRELSGVLMAVITVNAVLLAVRLDARLLAALAWIGAYLTPVLLSTGEDRAVALFAYLFLLDLGALALDHRKQWAETMPLAMTGTILLYAGWHARFFAPDRFGVAAVAVAAFTAAFAWGAARRERFGAVAGALLAGTLGLTAIAAEANRPEWLLALALAAVAGALHLAPRSGGRLVPVAFVAAIMPLAVWGASFYQAAAFPVAAAWVLAAGLLFVWAARPRDGREPYAAGAGTIAVALAFASVAWVAMAGASDRPRALALALLAQAVVALVGQRRWRWAEHVALAGIAAAVATWMGVFLTPGREGDALLLMAPAALLFAGSATVSAWRAPGGMASADAALQLMTATFAWTVLYAALHRAHPRLLGLVSLGLAAAYLALGAAAVQWRRGDRRQAHVLLGLAAVFVTLAIPVQLGLHGITLLWALEGVLLLALGLRFDSRLARTGGYVVLGLAVLRLFVRHGAPGAVPPLWNPRFGVWLFVIGALFGAAWMRRRAGRPPALERGAVPALTALALGLLFALLTGETNAAFDLRARAAAFAADADAARRATLAARVAVSVLWTVFATGLLAGGLAARDRALFYAAYTLFAVTVGKIVLVDTAALQAPYRMLSFLALALLLLAGAYLNLRFRERLLPGEGSR